MVLDTRDLCRCARFLAAAFILTWACQVLASPKGDIAAARVSQASYRHFLDDLLYAHQGDNRGFGAEHDLAAINIIAEMESYGLTVALEQVEYDDNIYTNIVGTMQGSLFPDQEYIVGAHYDSKDNPGADDNASGTALVLEAARVLTAYESDSTIRFIAFDREEQGLYGSWAYVNDHVTSGILGMISTDMVAWNRGTDTVEIHASPLFDAFKMDVAQAVNTYGDGLSYELRPQSNASDHAPFQQRGVPSCLLIEDWGNPYYHTQGDNVDTPNYIDYAFATRITRVVVGFLVDHAGVQVPLDCNDNGVDDLDDIASGYSLDCDRNFTPDECDPDCDETGIPDVCELAGTFTSSSTELSPL